MSDLKVSELLEGITPGTWEAKPNKYLEGQWLVQAGMPSNRVLARFGDRDELDETDLANARLIAAAPQLAREHASLTLEVAQLKQALGEMEEGWLYLYKWVERGLFDSHTTPKNALEIIAHHPTAPWKNGRWDVDHKPYAAALYEMFPRAALKESPHVR